MLFSVPACNSGLHSSLVNVDIYLDSPLIRKQTQDVVYPYQTNPQAGEIDPLGAAFGSSWRGVREEYPEYVFNP